MRPGAADRIRFAGTAAIREEIALAVPLYAGIASLTKQGDQVQWGGDQLYGGGRFAVPGGKARFSPVPLSGRATADDAFHLSTRRGKQFNSMVQREKDPLTGAVRRDVLMSEEDARRLSLTEGAPVRLYSDTGDFHGAVRLSPIKPGNLEVHWPEGMALIPGDASDAESGAPDYNALVRIEKMERLKD